LVNIDDIASRLPLFERALKTDVLGYIRVYEVNYYESSRNCTMRPPCNLLWYLSSKQFWVSSFFCALFRHRDTAQTEVESCMVLLIWWSMNLCS